MKILRWIFAIPLAFAISMAALTLLVFQRDIFMRFGGAEVVHILFHLETVIFFVLPGLLRSLFGPPPKKYAALISLAIVITFLVITFYFQLKRFTEGGLMSVSLEIAT